MIDNTGLLERIETEGLTPEIAERTDVAELIQELGLTPETEEFIQDNADDLINDIDDFDEDVQMLILENL
jgi:hypothetical protein